MNTTTSLDGVVVGTCWKCAGTGRQDAFQHVCGGVCFQCQGEGLKFYLPREYRSLTDSDLPRAVRLEVIRQALVMGRTFRDDPFLAKRPKAVSKWVSGLVYRMAATSGDVRVYDRAMVAIHEIRPRNWEKVAAKRAELFPGVVASFRASSHARLAA